jgi:murein DD-endopeptidase MepM/ murein hydrolase activator NlpD
MNLIFVSRRDGKARQVNLAHPLALAASIAAVGALVAGVFWVGAATGSARSERLLAEKYQPTLSRQQAEASSLRAQLQDRIDALSIHVGTLQAHLIRLNALGKRLAQMADINSSEFDFDHDPPQGGPENGSGRGVRLAEVDDSVSGLERELDFRGAQFSALEGVLLGRQLSADIRPTGRPVEAGYISSYFGERMDPFNGEEAFHKGIDFAAAAGTDVTVVAAGVVTYAGPREGYGVLVEVSHGNGLVTRYAHNSRALVNVGDTVQRGQALAIVGSTGRSTGPHVHFEVLKNDVAINPLAYVGR